MAKGIKAAPKKRKRKRLSEHARLVEERARSIPPGVVHDLFDTSTLPVPPPAPARHAAPGRFVSKPPPPPPRPSQSPEGGEDAELAELEDLEDLEDGDELVEVDGSEESQTDGVGSRSIPPLVAPELGRRGGAPGPSGRSRALPLVLLSLVVGGLALATGAELGRSRSVAPRLEVRTVAPVAAELPAPVVSPPGPVADDLPLLPPGVEPTASAAPTADSVEPASITTASEAPASSAVAAPPDAVAPEPALSPFSVVTAEAAIHAAFERARGCRGATDPKGVATVTLTYAPSGRVTTALVSGIFAGTSAGSCIAAALRSARIEPFMGALVTVKRSASLE